MKLTNENILIASLLGSRVLEQAPRFAAIENEISKHVMLPINIIPIKGNDDELYKPENYQDIELWMSDKAKAATYQFFPLSLKSSEDNGVWFTLPWEPIISIESNIRVGSKAVTSEQKTFAGTIKDRWVADDYDITITGAFYGQKTRGSYVQCYPLKDMEKLRDYFLTAQALNVNCELLQIHGINQIAIESISFPFTKGEYVQAYEIKAKSDFPWDLEYKSKKRNSLIVGMPEGEFDRTN